MIEIDQLFKILNKKKINFFSGVPDSILKELSIKLTKYKKFKHIIAVNEGAAISIGIGYYLSQKKIPCIYMQNSGLSNAINPLISIADKKVYSIPLVLLIGWRGSPNSKDEPQHQAKGEITREILKLLKIKYSVIKNNKNLSKFQSLIEYSEKNKRVVAALIPNGIIKKSKDKISSNKNQIEKLFFLRKFLKHVSKNDKIIASTGYNSREILYLRKKYNFQKGKDFYLVGGMGHTSALTLGASLFNKSNQFFCIDGDGSMLMHLGSLKTLNDFSSKKVKYILLNNFSHDSVGGQKTNSEKIDFKMMSKSLGFKKFYKIKYKKDIDQNLKKIITNSNNCFVEVLVKNTELKNLPRPHNLIKIKKNFMGQRFR